MKTDKAAPFRGYENINPAFTNAGVGLLEDLGIAKGLAKGEIVEVNVLLKTIHEPRYALATLDWFHVHGHLEMLGDRQEVYRATDKGRELFAKASRMQKLVAKYGNIKEGVKLEIGEGVQDSRLNISQLFNGRLTEEEMDALVIPAVTYLHESQLVDGPHFGDKAGAVLRKGQLIRPVDIRSKVVNNRTLFFDVLTRKGVLGHVGRRDYGATDEGQKLLSLGGYAELSLSYYDMLQQMRALSAGEETYGLFGTINRDAELNALASNGILNLRVTPHLVQNLTEHEALRQALNGGGAYIDYGSGGGDMLMQVAKDGPNEVEKLYGVDINPRAVAAAQKLVVQENLSDRISFVTGSIVDADSLRQVRDRMSASEIEGGVASINFILHDVGPELASRFLRAHSEVFPQVPLVVTETLRMPIDTIKSHPNYQAASFQYMHGTSGQHLYRPPELEELLHRNGFEVLSKKTHSSMPNADDSGRLPTIVTWVTRPKNF